MALDLTILNGHMARVFTDLPLTVYWQGQSLAAIRSTPSLSQTIEIGGPDEKIEFDLYLRRTDLPRTPREGDIFDVDKVKMRVVSLKNAQETGDLIAIGMAYLRDGSFP